MKKLLTFIITAIVSLCIIFSFGCSGQDEPYTPEEETVTVTFVEAGYKNVVIEVQKGGDIAEEDMPKTHYKKGYVIAWEDFKKTGINQNVTVNAVLTPKTYTLTFDANGGTVTTETLTVEYDSDYDLPTPTRGAYKFKYWISEGKIYDLSGVWKFDEDVALTAIWGDAWSIEYPTD